jgi:hypothetical protein
MTPPRYQNNTLENDPKVNIEKMPDKYLKRMITKNLGDIQETY